MNDERGRRKAAIVIAVVAIVLIAWFLSIHHDIDVEIEGEGTAEPSYTTVGHLGSVEIEFVPAEGWRLSSVELDGEDIDVPEGILRLDRVVSDHTVRAVFIEYGESFELTVFHGAGGSVDPSGVTSRTVGEEVVVSIVPDDGFVIDEVLLDGSSLGSINRTIVVMDSDHAVEVRFREAVDSGERADPWVTIDVDVQIVTTGADYGLVDPSGRVRVAYGGTLSIAIHLNPGYSIRSITAGGTDMGRDPVFSIEGITGDTDVDIVLSREARIFAVEALASSGGSIDPSGIIRVAEGGSVRFSMAADPGYELSRLMVDGAVVMTAGSSYVLSDVDADHTVRAEFAPRTIPPDVRLISLTVQDAPDLCYVGDVLDVSGMTVIAHYSNGTSRTAEDYVCSPTSWTSPRIWSVDVSYRGVSCSFDVVVPRLIGIEVERMPDVTTFAKGALLDLSGMVVIAVYADGPSRVVDAGHSPDRFDSAGTGTVLLTYAEGDIAVGTSMEVTVVDEEGFRVYVESYRGSRVENGSVVHFSESYSSMRLSEFSFDASNLVPGISQTIGLRVENSAGVPLRAFVYVSSLSGSHELAEQLILVCGTSAGTIEDIATMGMFVDLGTIGASGSTVEITFSFLHGPDNNEVMGKTVGFELGVFADREDDRRLRRSHRGDRITLHTRRDATGIRESRFDGRAVRSAAMAQSIGGAPRTTVHPDSS